jgi:uncharacterized protein
MSASYGLDLSAMFLLGFLGTGHCLGMCGPLVVALPGRFGRWSAHALYHLGRIGTYSLTGAVLGALGGWQGTAPDGHSALLTGTTQLQLLLAGVAALFLLFFGLNRLGLLSEPAWLSGFNPRRIPGFGAVFRQVLHGGHRPALLICGTMLGLLPCGLSYAAFARSLAAGGFLSGGLMCLVFGLGTLPGLLILGSGLGALIRRFRQQTEMIAGLIMIAMALFLAVDIWAALTNRP